MGRVQQSRILLVVALVMVPAWVGLQIWLFHVRSRQWLIPCAMFGPLVWAMPLGAYLGSQILKRRNIWWIFPAAVPVCWGISVCGIYAGECGRGIRARWGAGALIRGFSLVTTIFRLRSCSGFCAGGGGCVCVCQLSAAGRWMEAIGGALECGKADVRAPAGAGAVSGVGGGNW